MTFQSTNIFWMGWSRPKVTCCLPEEMIWAETLRCQTGFIRANRCLSFVMDTSFSPSFPVTSRCEVDVTCPDWVVELPWFSQSFLLVPMIIPIYLNCRWLKHVKTPFTNHHVCCLNHHFWYMLVARVRKDDSGRFTTDETQDHPRRTTVATPLVLSENLLATSFSLTYFKTCSAGNFRGIYLEISRI